MNIILTKTTPLDSQHQFVCVGLNCWGIGKTAAEAHKNAKRNAWKDGRSNLYVTRVAAVDSFGIDPVDGSVRWSASHDAKACKFCTVGNDIQINTDKTFKEGK